MPSVKKRPGRPAAPYARSSASGGSWETPHDFETTLLIMARQMVADTETYELQIAEVGERVASRLRLAGLHPKRAGKIVRLKEYMRNVHSGWETFLMHRISKPLVVADGFLRLLNSSVEKAPGINPASTDMTVRHGSCAPKVDVDSLDLSRL
mmetsp:Transcript_1590/g.4485  ORF Transcript_1590/g.4485 Transcript_1590/m.4485 type:complete len:152 (-) Transcript_1590:1008-1463(-)